MSTASGAGVLREVPLGPGGPVVVRGAVEVERTVDGWLPRRLPAWAREQIPDVFMRHTAAESTGIRLAFRTAARVVELEVRSTRMAPRTDAVLPPGVYELTDEHAILASAGAVAGSRYVFSFERPEGVVVPGPASLVRFAGIDGDGSPRDLELWLPYNESVELLSLHADAPVSAPSPSARLRWLHHGSSISHGYRAATATGTWPAVAARRAGVELTNLAFSGNAMLDPFTARTMRDTEAELITLKVGINLVNGDVMRVRAFRPAVDGFLDTLREGHPTTPIVVVSPIWCEPVEHSAGPTVQDPSRAEEWSIAGGTPEQLTEGKLSLGVIREELRTIVARRAARDPNLAYLDGLALYGAADAAAMPLPDNLHPGPDVQRLIGERFADAVLAPHAVRAIAANRVVLDELSRRRRR